MRITEYRIVLPTNVPQYQIGNLYMCNQRTRETAGNGEGIEVLKNEPYEEGDEKGQYTHKVMHFKSKVPAFIRWAIPDKYLHVHEKSHNSYPHFHTLYEMPGMGKDFYLLVESQHIPYDKEKGCPDNVLNLTKEELDIRQVTYLDILDSTPKPEKKEWDMHGFICPEAQVNSKLETGAGTKKYKADESKPPSWVAGYDGELMICVKVVKFLFHWRGLQTAVEKLALNTVFHDVFLDSHRALMCWAKDWFPLDIEGIRKLEAELVEEQKKQQFDRDDDEPLEPLTKPDDGGEAPAKDKKKDKK